MNLNDSLAGDKYWDICTSKVVMIPNYGDYLAWNDAFYQFMARDIIRKQAYEKVIRQKVKDKIVAEIGPGSKLFWTLMCAEAGAKKIYAVEENSAACQAARKIISQKGLADKIELIHGLSVETELPEKADICLSELIGCIGNSEGTACYLNDAKRFLKPDGIMIPEGCLTLLSPAVKPSEIYKDKFLDDLMESYEDAIYEKMGRKFPFTRYYIHNFPKSDIIAPPQVFEEMWFNDELITEHFDKVLEFQAMKNSLFDGLLLWINLHVGTDVIIDVMNTVTHWASTFIPMEPFDVRQGDFIEVRCLSEKASGMANPDYFFEARIKRDDMVVYNCSTESCYMPNE